MHRSSTSSSETTRRGWWLVLVVVACTLVSAELTLRNRAVRAMLPTRTLYYSTAVTSRVDAIEELAERHGRVDVIFTGSSVVRTDVHPLLAERVLGNGAIVTFNAALDGMWPAGVALYTERLWLPAARPRVVLQGIRYPELRVTAPAKHDSQIWTGAVEAGWRDGNPIVAAEAMLTERLAILQYRGVLTNWFRNYLGGAPGAESDSSIFIRGHAPRPAASAPIESMTADLSNDGTCAAGACEPGFAAIRRTRDAVRKAGAQYVLFNVPEHGSRWRSPDGLQRYRAYLDAVRAFATREDIPFVDVTAGDPFTFDAPGAFGDVSHMTAAGSERFTMALASALRDHVDPTRRLIVAAAPQQAPGLPAGH